MDSEDESIAIEREAKVVEKSLRALVFGKKMKRLSPHYLLLKEQMKDHTIRYVNVLCPDTFLATIEKEQMP